MNFIDRRFSFLMIPLLIVVIYLIMNFLPVILAVGAVVWLAVKGVKAFKEYYNKERKITYSEKNEDFKVANNEDPFDFSNKEVIDADYTEIK